MIRGKRMIGTAIDIVEKVKSGIRSVVEFPFRIIKEQFKYREVRYKVLRKKCRSCLYEMRSRKSLSIQKSSIVKGVVRPNGALGAIRGLPKLL